MKLIRLKPISGAWLGACLLFCWGILLLLFADNLGSSVRFFNDYSDRLVYAARGAWVLSGKVPYVDAFCEYPQVAVLFFSLPYLLLIAFFPSVFPVTLYYLVLYQLLSLAIALATVWILGKMIGAENRWRLLLLALPASAYFIFNRFDILPAFLCILSLYLFGEKKYGFSAVVLACGVMVKWYLLLILPIYLIGYAPLSFRKRVGMVLVFGITVLAFLLPTYLLGGLPAVLMPYTFHLGRGIESGSLLYFVDTFLNGLFGIHINSPWLMRMFFLLQFSGLALALIFRLRTREQVIQLSALSLIPFFIFAKFYSPQWWLWLLPLLIPLIRRREDALPVIGFDLVTYVAFPVFYDLFSPASKISISMALIQAVFLIGIASQVAGKNLLQDNRLSRLLGRQEKI